MRQTRLALCLAGAATWPLAAPAHAAAQEYWCMPTQICRADTCHTTDDEEASIRLHRPWGRTVMRAHAEDVPLTRRRTDGGLRFFGRNAAGDHEEVLLFLGTMEFRYTVTPADRDMPVRVARGECN